MERQMMTVAAEMMVPNHNQRNHPPHQAGGLGEVGWNRLPFQSCQARMARDRPTKGLSSAECVRYGDEKISSFSEKCLLAVALAGSYPPLYLRSYSRKYLAKDRPKGKANNQRDVLSSREREREINRCRRPPGVRRPRRRLSPPSQPSSSSRASPSYSFAPRGRTAPTTGDELGSYSPVAASTG